jgi:hypothetical protein
MWGAESDMEKIVALNPPTFHFVRITITILIRYSSEIKLTQNP